MEKIDGIKLNELVNEVEKDLLEEQRWMIRAKIERIINDIERTKSDLKRHEEKVERTKKYLGEQEDRLAKIKKEEWDALDEKTSDSEANTITFPAGWFIV